MNSAQKRFLLFFFFFFAFLFPAKTLAQVVINEFSSNADIEWVELFNTGEGVVDLTDFKIIDANDKESDDLNLSGCISAKGFRTFEREKGWLNNGGDTIKLVDNTGQILNEISYGDGEIPIPEEFESAGRVPDGGETWQIMDIPTPDDNECVLAVISLPAPTPTPTLTPAKTPTPTPTPTLSPTPKQSSSCIVEIKTPKDEKGGVLSAVKVYVDGNYIHHYAPETLEFCDNCFCEKEVSCGFGRHTIKLEKSGYNSFEEQIECFSGQEKKIEPVLAKAGSVPTPTKTPTLTPTLASTPTPTSALNLETKDSTGPGEILGEEASASFYPWDEKGESEENEKKEQGKSALLAKVFLILGSGMLFLTALYLWYNMRRKIND